MNYHFRNFPAILNELGGAAAPPPYQPTFSADRRRRFHEAADPVSVNPEKISVLRGWMLWNGSVTARETDFQEMTAAHGRKYLFRGSPALVPERQKPEIRKVLNHCICGSSCQRQF